MDLKQIRYFVAVADAGSFSAGARRAFVTQPTLSAAIAALEAELGFALFERNARGVSLTTRGLEALETARSILRETERLKAPARALQPGKRLRIGLLPTLPPELVTATLTRLQGLDLARTWQMEDAPLAKLRQRLANGRYDVVMTHLANPERGHRQFELATDRQALAVSARAYPRGQISPEILSGQPLIVRVHCEQLQPASRILDQWKVQPRNHCPHRQRQPGTCDGRCRLRLLFDSRQLRPSRSPVVAAGRREPAAATGPGVGQERRRWLVRSGDADALAGSHLEFQRKRDHPVRRAQDRGCQPLRQQTAPAVLSR